ncbi:MAG: hypothetical protein ACT4PL_05465, partial [Phycisphaerales bacterium]
MPLIHTALRGPVAPARLRAAHLAAIAGSSILALGFAHAAGAPIRPIEEPAAAAQPPEEPKPTRRRASAETETKEGDKPADAKTPDKPGEIQEGYTSVLGAAATVVPPDGLMDPLGAAGLGTYPMPRMVSEAAVPVPDRWRIGWPTWDRYNRQAKGDSLFMNSWGGDIPFTKGDLLNPYDRNVLKGDYPIIGNEYFLNLTAISDSFMQYRRNPTPSGNNAQNPGSFDIFRDGRQLVLNQNIILDAIFSKGYTAFRPVDYLLKVTPVFNANYVRLQENAVNVSPQRGDERYDSHAALQEAFAEIHLGDTSEYFDIATIKLGRQLFVSDFRGFIFNDITDGAKFTINFDSNRIQANLAFFNSPERDTNSGLTELNWRQQQVFIANCYIQDFMG